MIEDVGISKQDEIKQICHFAKFPFSNKTCYNYGIRLTIL